MPVENDIERKLRQALGPSHVEVVNESHMHNVPPGSESHFRLVVVADAFSGQSLVARHRAVKKILGRELSAGVHALSLHTFSGAEWEEGRQHAPASPPCLGGGKGAKTSEA